MFGIKIDRNLELSLTRQICDQLRNLVEKKEIKSSERLPSTRKMAEELKISRNIMIEVYEQLIAEGYLESRVGSGTYVKENIFMDFNSTKKNKKESIGFNVFKNDEGNEDYIENKNKFNKDIIYFAGGIPDLSLFPRKLWSKYLKKAVSDSRDQLYNYGSILGDEKLKKILVKYIFRVKGIKCEPQQIIIVSGSSEGFFLTGKTFSNTYKQIFIEDPTVKFIQNIFKNLKYEINPVEVDNKGMKIEQIKQNQDNKLILVTPSHQYPTGSLLPIQRRKQLIKIAETTDGFLIEDDYDSEFRLKGIPIPPLQVLNPDRVIYVGTFSKNMYPGLRLGFLIVPGNFIKKFREIKNTCHIFTSTIKQRAMAYFIEDRQLDRHIYRMKKEYKKRRKLLTSLLKEKWENNIIIKGDEAGMHLQAEFVPEDYSSIDWGKAVEFGVRVDPFETYSIINGNGKNSNKIVLGYGNLDCDKIKVGINRLYKFINNSLSINKC